LRQWFARECPYAHIVEVEYLPVKGTLRGGLGAVLSEAFDRVPAHPARIDGAYRVTLAWHVGSLSGRERWCALRKEGGGIELA
jgi:hypothetical protein